MGLDPEAAASAIRVSIGPATTRDEVLAFAGGLGETLPPVPGAGPPERGAEERYEMAAFDEISVREGVDRETVDAVRSVGERYKYGFSTDIETEYRAEGAERGHRAADLGEERRAGVADRLAAEGLPALAADGRSSRTGRCSTLPEIDFQDAVLLRAAEEHGGAAEVARRGRSDAARHLREARHPAEGADDPRRGRGRGAPAEGRKVAVDAVFDSVSVGTTFKAELAKAGVIFCSISEAVREHPELVRKYLGTRRALQRQLLCDAELGGVLGRVVRLRAAGGALPDGALDLFPDQRREHRAVRADADHRRQGRAT